MKRNFPFQNLIFFVTIFSLVTACKKKEIIPVFEPVACFYMRVADSYVRTQFTGNATYIDSNFYFKSCSDTGSNPNITYKWDFGDGATSTEKHPVHKYAKRGTHLVTLTVSNQNLAFDTLQQIVSVVLGDKNISFGNAVDAAPVAIEETDTNDFLLLSTTGKGANYYLIHLDSLLNQKSMKTFPSGYRLNSMLPTTDGNYIFTGTTQGANNTNELIKLKADGTLLWNKTLSTEDVYTYAAQTPDGGYAVIGSRYTVVPNSAPRNITVINKTDNNGNLQWQKLFDGEILIKTSDAAIEQDGIVVAGVRRKYDVSCSACDSLMIVKMNYAGGMVWKNSMLWGLNTYDFEGTHITRLNNGNYGVVNDTTKAIYLFTPSGNFVDRIIASNKVISITNAADGNLVTLQQDGGYTSITKLTLDGMPQWSRIVSGNRQIPSSLSSKPVGLRRLRNGGTIIIGTQPQFYPTGYGSYSIIYLLELDEAGKVK